MPAAHQSVLMPVSICPGVISTVGSQQALNPPWVQGSTSTTCMRLVQKAAERQLPAPHHYPKQQHVGQNGGHHQGHTGFEAAPWMGLGGVRHMDPDHMGQCTLQLLHETPLRQNPVILLWEHPNFLSVCFH